MADYSVVKRFFIILLNCLFANCFTLTNDTFHEELYIKNLPSGHVYAHFQFTTTWNMTLDADDAFTHFHLFPKALGEVLHKYSVQELHLSLTQGRWRHESWGYPVVDSPPGAELWVWFQEKKLNVDASWTDLVNVLSGMFCASLNFMDAKSTTVPQYAFRPHGAVTAEYNRYYPHYLRYSALPRENVCTENLTPWKKLLPCGTKSGLSTLLYAIRVFDATYHSQAINFRPVCMDVVCRHVGVELSQSLAVVFDPIVASFGSSSTKWDWTFKKLFGRMITSACPLASSSVVYFDLGSNNTTDVRVKPEPNEVIETVRGGTATRTAVYKVAEFVSNGRVLNLDVKYSVTPQTDHIQPPVIMASRFQTGYGQVTGGVMCIIQNNHPTSDIVISYLEVIPWFLRVYLHTLKIEYSASLVGNMELSGIKLKPMSQHYVPGKDRLRPYHLELLVKLPANSITKISFQFERQLLKWTEYPPDANHGFDINAAVISAVLPSAYNYTSPPQASSRIASIFEKRSDESGFFIRLHTESLLVTLPTPDFSMPYNVICLSCTVLAIAFGSIHNLTTRRFVVLDPNKKQGLLSKLHALPSKLREKLSRKKVIQEDAAVDVASRLDDAQTEHSDGTTDDVASSK